MRLSLRSKIAGGFAVSLALMLVLAWVTLSLFSSLRGVQRRVFDDAIPGLVTVDEIVRSYTAQSAAIRGYLIRPELTLLGQYRSEVESSKFWEQRALELFEGGEERQILLTLVAEGRAFHELIEDDVIPLAQQGRRSQAFRLLGEEALPLINDIGDKGVVLREMQDRTVAQSEADLRTRANQALLILVIVTLGVAAVGLALAIVLPRRLVANIDKLVGAARGIERGDLDQHIDIRSGDELEELAARFRDMQAGLKRLQQLALQDRELEIASHIQQNLLQRSLPAVPGVDLVPLQQQANLVGGDWYDVDVVDGKLVVAVADCSGKGIAAALMATVALSVLRAERRMGADARRSIERTNDALREATGPDSFTTMIYATIDPSGQARWLNMGHPPPFVVRAVANEDETGPRGYYLEGPRNHALGWFQQPGFKETSVALKPGDRLILYTDGFLEAKSADGEVFGENRLAEAIIRLAPLGVGSLGDELVREVERFAAGKLDDDLTMLVVEYQGAPVDEGLARPRGEEQWHNRR